MISQWATEYRWDQAHSRPLLSTSSTAEYEVQTFSQAMQQPPVIWLRPCCYSCQVSCFFAFRRMMSMLALRWRFELCYHSSASCLTSACSERSPSDACFKWYSLGHFPSSSHILAVESSDLKTTRCSVPSQHSTVLSSHWTCFSTCFVCSIDSKHSTVAAAESTRSATTVSSSLTAEADSISPQTAHYPMQRQQAAAASVS
jgi:hypothetical protein